MKSHGWTAIFLFSILMQINKQREMAACGQLQNVLKPRITFGQDAQRWPWHAAIYHQYNETDSDYKCGGTLVSPKFILTAAHCVSVAAEDISVSLGRLHLNASEDSAPFIKVAKVHMHPRYSLENSANDIAIITLATDAIFNSHVQPVCMWWSDKLDLSEVIGEFGTVVGWGLTQHGQKSNVLQETSLPVVPLITCLESNRDLFGHHLTSANFCAGTRNGTSVCRGDSGGSITFQDGGKYYIRGIVSVGADKLVDRSTNTFMCDSTQYAIFTDVAQYLPWIREITQITLIRKNPEIIACETVVRCEWIDTDQCAVFIAGESKAERECKIIFNETAVDAVKWLEVSGNGAVPDLLNAVDKFVKLEQLSLVRFKIVDRSRLSPFKNILRLSLIGIVNIRTKDIFVDFNNLEELTIQFNQRKNLPPGIFRNNKKIRKLSLTDNELEFLLPGTFLNNTEIRVLNLYNNQFKEIAEDLFINLTKLEELDLSNNQIDHLPADLFRNNSKLTTVALSFNKIKIIWIDLTTMPQLRYLYLTLNDCIDEDFDFTQKSLYEANEKIHEVCEY